MDLQTLIVLFVVAACAAYLIRLAYRTWAGKSAGACGGTCQCSKDEPTGKEM
jgi:hypothetical protein